jgi:pimeloyl-ACP methyl ester carboxylesterase
MHLRSGGPDRTTSGRPVIVLLHGFGANARLTWETSGWTATLEAAGRTWLAPDLPGHGASPKPYSPTAYTPDEFARSITEVLLESDCAVVDLVGYSFGGELALRYASDQPRRVRRLVAGGVGATSPFNRRAVLELHDHVFSQAKLVDPMLSLAWSVARTVPGNDPLALVALAEGMSGAPSLDEIHPFAGPSLLFNGSDDAVAAGIDRIAGRLSNAQRLVVPGRHHLSTLTARALKERAVSFLDIDGDCPPA